MSEVLPGMDDRVYFKQLLSGRDFAQGDMMARQMVNFVYLIGDRETGEAVVVDPAYAVQDLLDIVAGNDMRLTGVLGTHFTRITRRTMGGFPTSAPILKVQSPSTCRPTRCRGSGTPPASAQTWWHERRHVRGRWRRVELIHTPGHTPGSQCFLVDGRLVAGDTLFLEGCGRTDFPGSDPLAMYESIHTRLARVPDDAILFPGHLYSQDPSQSMGDTRRWNYVFRPRSPQEWMAMFGS